MFLDLIAEIIINARKVPPHVLKRNGPTKVKRPISGIPIIYLPIGYERIPPIIPVPKISPIYERESFFVYLYSRPPKSMPHILPGNARRVPSPKRFLKTLETNATISPHQGPKVTAHSTFIKCCTGQHLEPKTGIARVEPATAIAQ